MRIVNICVNAPFTENYTYQDNMLSEYQQRLGNEVTIITGVRTRDKNGKIVKILPENRIMKNGVRLIRIEEKKPLKKIKRIFDIYPHIIKYLEELRPELIIIHGLETNVVSYAIKYKKRHKSVKIVADNHVDCRNMSRNNMILKAISKIYKLRWKYWVNDVEKVYGVTSSRVKFAVEQYGIPTEKVDILLMGVDHNFINLADNCNNRKDIRKKYNIPEDGFVFVSGGKLDKHKEIISMMKAFQCVQNEKTYFLIFGSVDKEIETEFQKIVEENPNIIYVGYVPAVDTNKLLAASDFCLFAGRHSVLWEQAVGCGIPGLFRKYEENDHYDVNGNCIRVEDVCIENLSNHLAHVLQDRDYYESMRKAARTGAHQFSYYEIAKKSIEVC